MMDDAQKKVRIKKPDRKSKAKAAGLKSTFAISKDELLMTTFGRGNDAVLEKTIIRREVKNLNDSPVLSVLPGDVKYPLTGHKNIRTVAEKPKKGKNERTDILYCKEQLERRYFGVPYADNIHVQIAYNIMDIDKIMAVHINNIIYTINNIISRRDKSLPADHDLIGHLSLRKNFDSFISTAKDSKSYRQVEDFETLMHAPQRAYFGDAIFKPGLVIKGDLEDPEEKAEWERCYYILALLGMTRQALAHGHDKNEASILYTLGPSYDALRTDKSENTFNDNLQARESARKVLDDFYQSQIRKLNNDFLNKAKCDLNILFKLYAVTDRSKREAFATDFYCFNVKKDYKYLGFSIKKIREIIFQKHNNAIFSRFTEKDYESSKGRFNRLVDYMIYRFFTDDKGRISDMVSNLRATLDDEEKDVLYEIAAEDCWAKIGKMIDDLKFQLKGSTVNRDGYRVQNIKQNIKANNGITDSSISSVKIKPEAEYFSKLVYLLTLFLDGKEINDLLTTLVNKFQNIASLLSVLREKNIPCKFRNEYAMFDNSSAVADELQLINSFARMPKKPDDKHTKEEMYVEAAYILSYPEDEKTLREEIRAMMPDGTKIRKPQAGFKNFLCNNVINSSRFRYLVRYGNVYKMKELAHNKNVIRFVFNSESAGKRAIPDEQILRYYKACTGTNAAKYEPGMREILIDMITGLSYADFRNVPQDAPARPRTPEEISRANEKEHKKALVNMYLTVLYLLVKNLVYVNSRYFMAFHCLERDRVLYDPEKYGNEEETDDYRGFARQFTAEHSHNEHAMEYLEKNWSHSDPVATRAFRNTVEHLNAIQNADLYIRDIGKFSSYFELYHYLVQRRIMDGINHPKIGDGKNTAYYFDCVSRYHTYSKDFVKALNYPFAYNLPRYKNLSIDGLFDRNNPGDKGTIKPDEE